MSNNYDQLIHESLVIGRVEEVSPSVVTVEVDVEAPHGTSFAHGTLQRFPRVNGFVVLPCEDGAILAVVLWIGMNEASAPRTQPPDALGLPTPRRRLRAVPLGLLRSAPGARRGVNLERGALLFPSVGDPVRLPTAAEAAATVPAVGKDDADSSRPGLMLGSAPMAAHTAVTISANRLFGRHLAILGNTGSGKSCSLTHLLRESTRHTAAGRGSFRAVVLDLNGEYGHAFDDLAANLPVRRYTIGGGVGPALSQEDVDGADIANFVGQLRVPYWLWNYREWHAFADPSGRSQAPVLRQALHMLRSSSGGGLPAGVVTLVMGRRVVREFQNEQIAGANTQAGLAALDKVLNSCAAVAGSAPPNSQTPLTTLQQTIASVLNPKRGNSPDYPWKYQVAGPDAAQCQLLASAFEQALTALGVPDLVGDVSSVDSPVPFDATNLVELLGVIAVSSGADVGSWIAPMQDRLAVAMSDQRLVSACGFLEGETLDGWIESLLGTGERGQITVLDLSLVPAQAQQVVAGVIARVLLETLERHRRAGPQVPVILAVEEAHALIRRRSESNVVDGSSGMADLCREAFERIGREGRKFGLSLVVSSQRPSELSETALSQCNSYLIHRIVNARDQDFVRRLVPDNLGTLLNEIASYPARTALLMGAAAEIPVMVEVAELDKRYRPNSPDPDFEAAWRTGAELRTAEVTSAWASIEESSASSAGPTLVADQLFEKEPPF
jgi:hypothetical protein